MLNANKLNYLVIVIIKNIFIIIFNIYLSFHLLENTITFIFKK